MPKPRILIPEPISNDPEYCARGWPQYAAGVREAGGEPVLVPLHATQEELAALIAGAQGVVLPGSHADVNPEKWGAPRDPHSAPPDPLREAADELLLQDAFNLRKPILGICYGLQSMNVWCGGSLRQHLETPVNHAPGRDIAEAHPVVPVPGSRLAGLLRAAGGDSAAMVNSSHHQALERIGGALRLVASSPDDDVAEAVEGVDRSHFALGVQWHPERTRETSPLSREIFRSLVEAASAWAALPNG
jgi:putative glutamine amidotransferase